MFQGKLKAITFSYDDGVTQDQRLISILNKYGLKCTFNLNSEHLGNANALIRENVTVAHCKPRSCEIEKIYKGHEVASHTLTHPFLPELNEEEIINQVESDRINLSELVGYEVVGFAYPCGGKNYNSRVSETIKNKTGIKYCRTTISNYSFSLQNNLYEFQPTVYHHGEFSKMIELGKEFINLKAEVPQILYIWGHAYEFDINNDWDKFEDFCKIISNKEDIFYGTNKEVLLDR